MSALTDIFDAIADAIRAKNGSSDTYTPAQMASAIEAIPSAEYDTPTPVSSLSDAFDKIADAIRSKLGSQDTFTPSEMPDAIASIPVVSGHIYGIRRSTSSTSPTWERTDDAENFTYTSYGVTVDGTVYQNGHSDFDNCYPWSNIVVETFSDPALDPSIISRNEFVKIPKFWFKRYIENGYEYIKIADHAEPGFLLHPAFNMGGVERDCFYVSAFNLSNVAFKGRADIRAKIKSFGNYYLCSISAWSAIQILAYVEFGTYFCTEALVKSGVTKESVSIVSQTIDIGYLDVVPNLNGHRAFKSGNNTLYPIIWRGIRNIFGQIEQCLDGINVYDGTYYICNNPDLFADDTSEGYSILGYTYPMGFNNPTGLITSFGLDVNNPAYMLANTAINNTTTDYTSERIRTPASNVGWRTMMIDLLGINATTVTSRASFDASVRYRGRAMYLPPIS